MNIDELIKSAISDQGLRAKLLSDPLETCKEKGVFVDISSLYNLDQPLFADTTLMQGGYRP